MPVLVFEYEVDQEDIASFGCDLLFDDAVLPKPDGDVGPGPDGVAFGDVGDGRGEAARTSLAVDVLVDDRSRPADLACDLGLIDPIAMIDAEDVDAESGASNVADCAEDRFLERRGRPTEVEDDDSVLERKCRIVAARFVKGVEEDFVEFGDSAQDESKIKFQFTRRLSRHRRHPR